MGNVAGRPVGGAARGLEALPARETERKQQAGSKTSASKQC